MSSDEFEGVFRVTAHKDGIKVFSAGTHAIGPVGLAGQLAHVAAILVFNALTHKDRAFASNVAAELIGLLMAVTNKTGGKDPVTLAQAGIEKAYEMSKNAQDGGIYSLIISVLGRFDDLVKQGKSALTATTTLVEADNEEKEERQAPAISDESRLEDFEPFINSLKWEDD